MTIQKVKARQILDSRGNPTVEVDLAIDGYWGRAAVPSGASTGAYEAHELRDKDSQRYLGRGVIQSLLNIAQLGDELEGQSFTSFKDFDQWLKDKDGSSHKSYLGANTLLGLSLAYVKAQAQAQNLFLFEFLLPDQMEYVLPVPLMNILNGGTHANNGLDVQEFMIVPVCGGSFSEALRAGVEIFHHLKAQLVKRSYSIAVGDEGGFAPNLKNNEEALDLIMSSIEAAGYVPGEDIFLALDVASTELFEDGYYKWENQKISSEALIEIYGSWCARYPLISIEDGAAEDDWSSWIQTHKKLGNCVQLVGDDLFVTNIHRLQKGIEKKAANAILIKVNQIGTLWETVEAISMGHKAGYETIMSHRSGETEDVTIADLAVGLKCSQIKTGSPCRGERTAKYNQLLRIEQHLGSKATFRGLQTFKNLL